MSALLLQAIDARHVPFSHIPLGGLFAFQGRFYTRVSGADGRPVARRQREPATRIFIGAMVQEVHALEGDRFFVTEFLEQEPEGTTLKRMPVAEWPMWAADLQRQLMPVEPRSAIHHEPGRWDGFGASVGRVLRSLGVLLGSLALAPFRAIRVARERAKQRAAAGEFAPLHDWLCDKCWSWNPDWRDENPCAKCGAPRPDLNQYRKHVP